MSIDLAISLYIHDDDIMTFIGWNHYAYYIAILAVGLLYLLRRHKQNLPYPPGPKGLPLLGNILDVPSSQEWITYANWSKKYSTFRISNAW